MSPAGYAIDTSFAKTSIVSSWMYGAMSATHETSARPSVMISASIEAGAVAVRVAAAHEREQPDHERRVDEEVHAVADRRERHLAAEDARVGVRVEVAEPEQREAEREEQPRALCGGAVAADAGEDRQDRQEAQHVHDRAGALERRDPDVEGAEQRTAGEQQLPGRRAARGGA